MPLERHQGKTRRGGDVRAGHWDRSGKTYRGKAERKQAQILHKAAVKKKYSRVLKNYEDDTPEFYKEIFAQIDSEQATEKAKHPPTRKATGNQPKKAALATAVDNDEAYDSASIEGGADRSSMPASTKNKREKTHKPNPLRRAQQVMEQQQRELEAIREKEQQAREQKLKEIAEKKVQREKSRTRMMKKTRRGQPAMAGRIANMLDQLRAEARSK